MNCSDLLNSVTEGLQIDQNEMSHRMKNFVPESDTMDDDFGHGSHCAGIIASRNLNNIVGLAPKCKLYVGKIRDSKNSPSVANMIAGIRWAAGIEKDSPQDIDIISMSNGSLLNIPDMQPTIDEALKRGKILIFSIGNRNPSGNPSGGYYPAICTGAVTSVGAVDFENNFLDFSYQYNNLTICCPGIDILSYWISSEIRKDTGTSQAAAICAGIVALLVSKLKQKGEKNIQQKILNLLTSSGSKTTPSNYTYRFINPIQLYNSIK
jgi:major intracellular serine protease